MTALFGPRLVLPTQMYAVSTVRLMADLGRLVTSPQRVSTDRAKPDTPTSEAGPAAGTTPPATDATRNDSRAADSAPRDSQIEMQLPQRPAPRKSPRRDSRGPRSAPTSPLADSHELPGRDRDDCSPVTSTSGSASVPIPALSSHGFQQVGRSAVNSVPPLGSSPTLTELLMPFTDNLSGEGGIVPFQMPDDFRIAMPDVPELDPLLSDLPDLDEDVEEVFRDGRSAEDARQVWVSHYDSGSSFSSPSSAALHLWQGPVNYLYTQPEFPPESPEMLLFRFDKLTCGILSVMDGPSENPWRSLIWPLAQQSPALYHAVTAMTAFHSSTDVPSLRLVGHEHKQASIRFIQEGIRDQSMSDETAIATALALGFSESWDQHTATGNTHIKGAQALVKRALAEHQLNPLHGVELARLKFLCNAWVYMDVIARLTSVDSDESNDFDNTFLFSTDSPQMVMGGDRGPPGFGIDFGMPIDARLDPLMGCAGTLFPLIGRVANLVRKVCRSQTNSPAVISQANDLKLALETWEPPAFIEPPEDPTSQVQHALQTAEAYRWATLLHLHQSVPELPSLSTAELAQKALTYLATVPLASRTVIVQIYPLMVAGCEAVTAEDRQWVRDRWTAMGARMRIGVIDKSATVTEEVWRRKDAYEAQPTTQRKLVATADLQPARQRGEKLKRSHTGGFDESAPGRNGMVFSWIGADAEPGGGGGGGRDDSKTWPRREAPKSAIGTMDSAYTVRGHLHWVGVMWDWGWEGELDSL